MRQLHTLYLLTEVLVGAVETVLEFGLLDLKRLEHPPTADSRRLLPPPSPRRTVMDDDLQQLLINLKLKKILEILPRHLERAEKEGSSYTEYQGREMRFLGHRIRRAQRALPQPPGGCQKGKGRALQSQPEGITSDFGRRRCALRARRPLEVRKPSRTYRPGGATAHRASLRRRGDGSLEPWDQSSELPDGQCKTLMRHSTTIMKSLAVSALPIGTEGLPAD